MWERGKWSLIGVLLLMSPWSPTPEARCQPPTREHERECEQGLIWVETDRFMPASALERVLQARGLAFNSPYVHDQPPAAQASLPRLQLLDRTWKPNTPTYPAVSAWKQRLADPLVARTDVSPIAYVDGVFANATVTFVSSATDEQIEDYLRRKGVVEMRSARFGFTRGYYVRVPIGTEHQWSDVLRAASPSIVAVHTVPIEIAVPAAP
jgi:hypothetical protein